ncbi:MAG: hypothetical protein KGI27_15230, partial [Thaumarchaeota archaeon]|nr:hypothetical protein [Nitrososphaerota archaeon]
IGTPFTLSSAGAGTETAQLVHVTSSISPSSGLGTVTLSAGNQNATNLQEDESFSARPIFNFTNAATGAGQVNSTTALFINFGTGITMNTLLKTIHDTN